MSERSDVAFGFTVGPVMPAAREGAAGDRERYREMLAGLLASGNHWVSAASGFWNTTSPTTTPRLRRSSS